MASRRRCGTCRYYEPSPLKGKGWCRNPLLYDGHQNHLVDASEYSCFRTFGRHWDAKEEEEAPEAVEGPVAEEVTGGGGLSDEEAALLEAAAEKVRQAKQVHTRRRRPAPVLHTAMLPWVVAGLAILLIAAWTWSSARGGGESTAAATATPTATAAATASPSATTYSAAATTPTPAPRGEETATPAPEPAPTIGAGVEVQVASTDGKGLKLRETPGTESAVLRAIDEGAILSVVGGPSDADGYTWWQVTFEGQTGWCAGDWLTLVTAQ